VHFNSCTNDLAGQVVYVLRDRHLLVRSLVIPPEGFFSLAVVSRLGKNSLLCALGASVVRKFRRARFFVDGSLKYGYIYVELCTQWERTYENHRG
jgi:hypothetical protein